MEKKAVFVLCVTLIFIINACRPVKKVQKIETAIGKIDTAHVVVVKPVDTIDSLSVVKGIIKNLAKTRIDFKTFSAKVKFDYQGANDENHATANIRIRKDSIIWVSITGPLNIEGIRMIVTKDSVKLINYSDRTVEYRSVNYLQDLVQVPLNFYDLQDFIVGNPIFVDSNVVSYKATTNGLQVLMIGKVFKNLVTLENTGFKVIHSKLDDVDPMRNRTCDITFSDYKLQGYISFATTREITVAEKSKLDINLDFKQYSFNQPETFPFTVSRKFKKKQ